MCAHKQIGSYQFNIYNFIWHGNDKIKRTALINDIEDEELKMLDIESMISAQRIMVLKKYFDDNESSWKVILDEFLQGVGGKFILFCNFNTRKLTIHIPIFYRECLEAWSKLVSSTVNTYDDIVNQIISNNKNIVVQKASIFEHCLFSAGVVKIGELLSDTGKFFEGAKVSGANLSTMDYFKLMSIIDEIPNNWRLVIKHNSRHFPPQLLSDSITIIINEKEVDLSNVTSKKLYSRKSRKANSFHC